MNYIKIFGSISAFLVFLGSFFVIQTNIPKDRSLNNATSTGKENPKASSFEKYKVAAETKADSIQEIISGPKIDRTKEITNQVPTDQKIVALTFDADMTHGMENNLKNGKIKNWYNEEVIKVLENTQTPATLFLTGLWIKNYPTVTEELAKNPLFEIANHSYSHPAFSSPCYKLPAIGDNLDEEEIVQTERLLEISAPNYKKYFRFPGLCYDAFDVNETQKLGYRIIGGDVKGLDGFTRNTNVIISRVVSGVKPGSIIILHMHDGPNAPETGKALPEIIRQLKEKGYKFVKISQLLNNEPDPSAELRGITSP